MNMRRVTQTEGVNLLSPSSEQHQISPHNRPAFNPPYGKRWQLHVFTKIQYLTNLTHPIGIIIESHIFAKFVAVLTTLCMLGLKF